MLMALNTAPHHASPGALCRGSGPGKVRDKVLADFYHYCVIYDAFICWSSLKICILKRIEG